MTYVWCRCDSRIPKFIRLCSYLIFRCLWDTVRIFMDHWTTQQQFRYSWHQPTFSDRKKCRRWFSRSRLRSKPPRHAKSSRYLRYLQSDHERIAGRARAGDGERARAHERVREAGVRCRKHVPRDASGSAKRRTRTRTLAKALAAAPCVKDGRLHTNWSIHSSR